MTEPVIEKAAENTDKALAAVKRDVVEAERILAVERGRRRDVLARLRRIVTDAQSVERRVIDDYARADVERRQSV